MESIVTSQPCRRLRQHEATAWLFSPSGCRAGIIVSLVLISGFEDVALRDSGLLVAALALTRLAPTFRRDTVGASKWSAS
jgi:hypothetical protein